MDCGSGAMDIHESGVVSGIGISPAARHVCCASLVYSHKATVKNVAKGYVVHIMASQLSHRPRIKRRMVDILLPGVRLTSEFSNNE